MNPPDGALVDPVLHQSGGRIAVVPAYNEAANLMQLLPELRRGEPEDRCPIG